MVDHTITEKPASGKGNNVTIYTTADFLGGIVRCEGKLIEHGTKKYAQYDAAPFVHFIPKGKRKSTGFVKADSEPYLVIVEGSGPEAPDMFTPLDDAGCKMTRYHSHDPRYLVEMDDVLMQSGARILADYRHGGQVARAEKKTVQEQ